MNTAPVPMQTIGPMLLSGPVVNEAVMVPLATYEIPLWATTNRGAKVSRLAGGIVTAIIDERMTRSILLEAASVIDILAVAQALPARFAELQTIVATRSRFAKLIAVHPQLVGCLLYLRFEFTTGDAAGHNMVTQAADDLMQWLLQQYPVLRHISVSGNVCVDKKVSAINGLMGRGKHVIAEILIPRAVCQQVLKTEPALMAELNIKKNLIGSIVAGGLRTANAHFANMLLGFYLATGQDAANIVEGSQGMVHTELRGEDLYFSVSVPNLIVGTVGNGKELPFVHANLTAMGCTQDRAPGDNARRLAVIAAATILCGELSLMAVQTNPGELMKTHIAMERHTINPAS